ncbi:hypothetical protein HELRODRAFT_62061 [Helobdella robusta]|uniref:UBC core domain-containing protein n=1 Tax=Helobdella robusta TaxID=6412 RepID=T1FWV1_HELRO|nr:hypothetical protein HELRODRAFT_62061 [Helobdella robusta]ESO12835.1 hypothetical protein HELRODRAFT_62061 [Helobdella robusta]
MPPNLLRSRLKNELASFNSNPPPGLSLSVPCEYEMRQIVVLDENSPYKGGIFKLAVSIPYRYPFDPPQVKFNTPIYHPNIDSQGRICLNLLSKGTGPDGWSCSLTIEKVLLSIQALISNPNPDDPLDPDIALEFKNNRQLFDEKAKELTKKCASQNPKVIKVNIV